MGLFDGECLVDIDGCSVGLFVGYFEGDIVGIFDESVGEIDGVTVEIVGANMGLNDGELVGPFVGEQDCSGIHAQVHQLLV